MSKVIKSKTITKIPLTTKVSFQTTSGKVSFDAKVKKIVKFNTKDGPVKFKAVIYK